MSGKVTAVAPANIAFIKYWGARDLERAIPCNPSISMTLSRCVSRCTVEHLAGDGGDEVSMASADGRPAPASEEFTRMVRGQLARIRKLDGASGRFRVVTSNSFPTASGLASSASGFAALTLATTRVLGLELPRQELSSLARLSGSGSAARSVLGGYVEWPASSEQEDCYARHLASHDDWDLRDVIAVVDSRPKRTSSREGHRRALTSPHFKQRLESLPARLDVVRQAIVRRDIQRLGPAVEEDSIDLHLIAMSSRPPIFYWQPGTLAVLEHVRELRASGVPVYATMDAGPNVHLICPAEAEPEVARAFSGHDAVESVIRDGVGPGPSLAEEHLF